MFKRIISRAKRYLIPRLSNNFKNFTVFGYTIGSPTPDFPGLPADFVGIQQEGSLAPKVIYNKAGIPTGLRILDSDGIWFKAYTEKYASLENRHFDSFESFNFYHDQIGG